MPKKLLIILLIVVIGGGTILGYFWWQKGGEKEAEKPKTEEQTEPESVRKIIIPSSLNPDDVMAQFVSYIPPWGGKLTKDDHFWKERFEIESLNEGFVKAFSTAWYGSAYYLTKDEEKLGGDAHSYVLDLTVLKYKSHEFAQKDYLRISTEQDFEDIVFEGIKLKNKVGPPPMFGSSADSKSGNLQQYLLHSNNFIIYASGLKEAAEDVMIRLIDQYAME